MRSPVFDPPAPGVIGRDVAASPPLKQSNIEYW